MGGEKKSSHSNGIGFFGLLTVLFVALKLLDVISWSWWYVLMPLYALPVILIVLAIGGVLIAGVLDIANDIKHRRMNHK